MKRRLVVTLEALAVAMAMGIPAAEAAGKPVKVPVLEGQIVHPCKNPTYGLKYVWRRGGGDCFAAVDSGAELMWPANDAPPGIKNSVPEQESIGAVSRDDTGPGSSPLDGDPDDAPPLGPAAVVDAHVRPAQDAGEDEPAERPAMAEPAVGDDLVVACDPQAVDARLQRIGW